MPTARVPDVSRSGSVRWRVALRDAAWLLACLMVLVAGVVVVAAVLTVAAVVVLVKLGVGG